MKRKIISGLVSSLFPVAVWATPTVTISTIDGQPASASYTMGSEQMLVITGVAADTATFDPGTKGSVLLTNLTTGELQKLPIFRRMASPELVENLPSTTAESDAKKLFSSGFIASVDSFSLPTGTYKITGVELIINGSASPTRILLGTPIQVVIPASRTVSDVALTDSSGTSIPVGLAPSNITGMAGKMTLTGYPALREGQYTLTATARNAYGKAATQSALNVTYRRPVVSANVATPAVENFPGSTATLTLNDTLTQAQITGTLTGKATLETNVPYGAFTLQGQQVSFGTDTDVSVQSNSLGKYIVAGASSAANGKVMLWLNAPDAPNIEVSLGAWDPDASIKVAPNMTTLTPQLDRLQMAASGTGDNQCSAVFGNVNGTAISGSYPQVSCAVRYSSLPKGIVQDSSNSSSVSGYFSQEGTQSIAYDTGVILNDPVSGTPTFYRAKSHSVDFTMIKPTEPVITFSPIDQLLQLSKSSPGMNLTYTGPNIAGRLDVVGKYKDMTVNITPAGGNTKVDTTINSAVRDYISTNITSLWGTQDFVVESFYNKYPSAVFRKTLTFTAVPKPPVVVLANTTSISTSDTIIKGNLGVYMGASVGFAYDGNINGDWLVQLNQVDMRGALTPIGDATSAIDSAGNFTVNIGKVAPGNTTLMATAQLQNAAQGIGMASIKSTRASLYVRDGAAITGTLTTHTPSGQVPFTPAIGIVFDSNARVADIGKVTWYASTDGQSYSAIDGASNISLRPVLSQAGKYWYKATLTNRYTDAVSELAPVVVQAFDVPKVTITGDTATFVGVTANLSATASVDSDFTWYIMKDASDKNPQILTGPTIAITPTTVGDMLVKVVANEVGSPADNPARNASLMTVLRVTTPTVLRPMISGPAYVETGKTYDYVATMTPLFAPGLKTSLVERGHWVLPDGSTIDSDKLQYTVQPGDKNIRYEAWVDSMPTVKAAADFNIRTWTYTWPDWQITTRVVDNRVPANLRMEITPKTPNGLQGLGGEVPQYTWNFPSTVNVVSQSNESAVIEVNEPGNFQVGASVSDSRGNTTLVTSDTVQIMPAPDLIPDMLLTQSDRWNRSPENVLARINLLTVPKNDSFGSAEFRLDGVSLGTVTTPSSLINVPTAGDHQVDAVVRSTGGKVATVSKMLTTVTGDNPVCSFVQYGDGIKALSLVAKCSVSMGSVAGYRWLINGQPYASSTYMVTFAKADLDKGITSVDVTAITDKGQEGTAHWPTSPAP